MTIRVRFCLSFDPLKRGSIAFKLNISSMSKPIADTDVLNDVTHTRQSVIIRVVIRFYDMALSTE